MDDGNSAQEAVDHQEEFKERMRFLENFEHPITCEITTFSSEPVPVVFESEIDSIKQIAAGDYHNVVLTIKGKVYTWGMASNG